MGYFNLIKLNATTSTNDYLKQRRLEGKCNDGDLVWTTYQTAGRGQSNKVWESEAGNSLSVSIYRAFGEYSPELPFSISSAFATAIVSALKLLSVPELNIKWPNDILSCNKKIGGILIENTFKNNKLTNSILGFGLNVNQLDFSKFPHAASLSSLTKKKWNIENVLEALIHSLEHNEFLNLTKHQDVNLDAFNSFLWRKGKPSKFKGIEGVFEAIPLEVTKRGGLVISGFENEKKKELVLADARMIYTHK